MSRDIGRIRCTQQGARVLAWNPAVLAAPPEPTIFSPTYWREAGALRGSAAGRGEAYFLTTADEAHWVLRHYRRGGLLARFNRDAYLFTGTARSRPVRELSILADLQARALPVPTPVAAQLTRAGPCYRADLIIAEIPDCDTLADRLAARPLADAAWTGLGALLARFHAIGLWHADLNARNILIDGADDFHLIDFDRARFRSDGRWRQANLSRLRRSLDKFAACESAFHFADAQWQALLGGYRGLSADTAGL